MSPVIRECEQKNLDYFILHTGQHYSYRMDRVFFEQLELPDAKYNLDIGSASHGEQTGRMLIEIEKVLIKEKPDVVLVQGDTNSVLAGALAASKLHIKVGHVEAGLRSYDRNMPEETNRVLTDHCSDYLFTPTEKAGEILLGEGISEDKIFLTGNTIVDAVQQNVKIVSDDESILNDLKVRAGGYFLATAHRQENVDNYNSFVEIVRGLEETSRYFNMPVIYSIHPRSKKRIEELGIKTNDSIIFIDPLDYIRFLQLESNACVVLTDSGGVQEEACILGVPCVTLRENTERPETIEVGANVLSGSTESVFIVQRVIEMINIDRTWENPFGDGNAGREIIRILTE